MKEVEKGRRTQSLSLNYLLFYVKLDENNK